ncbi:MULTISPECIES: hypothetical protein [Paraburkholderia]|nr:MULTISPECIES: hypothetical protein [Paraburkholderia]MCX4163551.1 hypothetical protein [Paraburkholderia megapolitana]MDN7159046.1 hypothetical protein [Paraburkholderia sp. CHISQ3]MDQ6496093.1 hypothetical protein [Paraburkholderia megapolitana]
MKATYRTAGWLMLALIPEICLAEAGQVDAVGLLLLLLSVVVFVVVWLVMAFGLFRLLRKSSARKRLSLVGLFLALPVIALYSWGPIDQFLGTPGTRVEGVAESPVVVAGVTFPAGTQIQYEQTGGGYWHKTPIGAQGDKAVMLGPVEIKRLWREDVDRNMLSLSLTRDQTIDGWSCSADPDTAVEMKLTDTQPRFQSCQLAAPRTIDGIDWPIFTEVTRADNGDWALLWNTVVHKNSQPVTAFGFPLQGMQATYSASLALKQWSADSYSSDTKVGDYVFSKDGSTDLTWVTGGDIRIEGNGKNVKTGEAINCLLMQSKGLRFTPCTRTTND